jgi:uncharacterized protein (PEP-CTERM system associated)
MRAAPSRGGRHSISDPPRRGGLAKPRIGSVGAGILAVLAGFPVLAQVGAFPPAEPSQERTLPPAETETTPAAPSPTGLPPPPVAAPASGLPPPLGELPQQTGAPAAPLSPFGPSPDVFPGLFSGRPDRQPPAASDSPFGLSTDIFPGLLGGRPTPAAPSDSETTTPDGLPEQAAPAPPVTPPGEPDLAAPDLAPPGFVTPTSGYGNLSGTPLLPPSVPPRGGALGPVRPGAVPLQAGDLRAPWLLIRPNLFGSIGYTDNPRNAPGTFPDAIMELRGSADISIDTVRLQSRIRGSLDYLKYARATNQDRLNAYLTAYGLGTVVRDHLFIDGRSVITQVSRTGGLGFAEPTLLRRSDTTQLFTTSVTPIARESFGGYVDGEVRYNFATTSSQDGSLLGGSNTVTSNLGTNLQNSTRNEVTASLATGRLFTVFGSKLTFDALKIDSNSASRSTQVRATNDVVYQFNQKFAGLGRIGYENLDFPLQPAASFTGANWSLGGRYTPFQNSYFIGSYGRQDGQLGFTGALRYEITARTYLLASYTRNRASQQQQAVSNLNTSALDANGNVVDQFSGLPISLVNTQFGLSNAVFNFQTARAGVRTQLDRDVLGLFAFYEKRTQLGRTLGTLTSPADATDTSGGVRFSWQRLLTPRLNSNAQLGFARAVQNDQNTLTASWVMTYLLAEKLTAVLQYQFINVDSNVAGNSYRRNQVEIGLTRSF